jgi:hypothetical protein
VESSTLELVFEQLSGFRDHPTNQLFMPGMAAQTDPPTLTSD